MDDDVPNMKIIQAASNLISSQSAPALTIEKSALCNRDGRNQQPHGETTQYGA
jgi:hypothetical protein